MLLAPQIVWLRDVDLDRVSSLRIEVQPLRAFGGTTGENDARIVAIGLSSGGDHVGGVGPIGDNGPRIEVALVGLNAMDRDDIVAAEHLSVDAVVGGRNLRRGTGARKEVLGLYALNVRLGVVPKLLGAHAGEEWWIGAVRLIRLLDGGDSVEVHDASPKRCGAHHFSRASEGPRGVT